MLHGSIKCMLTLPFQQLPSFAAVSRVHTPYHDTFLFACMLPRATPEEERAIEEMKREAATGSLWDSELFSIVFKGAWVLDSLSLTESDSVRMCLDVAGPASRSCKVQGAGSAPSQQRIMHLQFYTNVRSSSHFSNCMLCNLLVVGAAAVVAAVVAGLLKTAEPVIDTTIKAFPVNTDRVLQIEEAGSQ